LHASFRPGGDISWASWSGASMIISTRVPPSVTVFSQRLNSGTWKITIMSAFDTASSVPLHWPIVGTPTLVQPGRELTHIS
jgi:hypothetical protein